MKITSYSEVSSYRVFSDDGNYYIQMAGANPISIIQEKELKEMRKVYGTYKNKGFSLAAIRHTFIQNFAELTPEVAAIWFEVILNLDKGAKFRLELTDETKPEPALPKTPIESIPEEDSLDDIEPAPMMGEGIDSFEDDKFNPEVL